VNLFPRLVTHNASLKIAALAAAIFLWAIAPADPAQQESLSSVPVRVQVADLDWTLAGEPSPATVEVRLSGSAREMIRLAREGAASIRVPVETVSGADTTVSLRRDWVALGGASGLVVEEVLPTSVRLQFERVGSASLAVEVTQTGELREGLAFAAPIRALPEAVDVRGPARLLEGRATVATREFDITDLETSGFQQVAIDTTGLEGALLDPREVRVEFRVAPSIEWELPSVRVRLTGPGAAEYEVEPATLPMTLAGAQSVLAGADLRGLVYEADTREIGILEVGERRMVPVVPAGVPGLLRAVTVRDSVLVTRPDPDGAGAR